MLNSVYFVKSVPPTFLLDLNFQNIAYVTSILKMCMYKFDNSFFEEMARFLT